MATKTNMKIWDQVCTSDPEHLKPVSFGARSFTAIDPQSQIQKATEVFGPVGEGWGWDATMHYIHTDDGQIIALADVILWHGDRANSFGPFPGCRKFYATTKSGAKNINEEAPKMAVTDGLTKGLSHLGFNADVFLGKMDGNKYAAPKGSHNDDGGW